MNRTSFIVGAGAGMDFRMPTGATLKKDIGGLLNFGDDERQERRGDEKLRAALAFVSKSTAPVPYPNLRWAAQRICNAMPQSVSIDTFLDAHNADEAIVMCGKIAIARAILLAERNGPLYLPGMNLYERLDFGGLEQVWLNKLWLLVTQRAPKQALIARFSAISLIVFNYDRCIEQFFLHSLMNSYDMKLDEARDTLSHLETHHPYGTVGWLPWQGQQPSVGFGEEVHSSALPQIAKELKTYTERQDHDSPKVVALRQCLAQADTIVFLGFAFHPDNMALIKPPATTSAPKRIFATALHIPNDDTDILRSQLPQWAGTSLSRLELRNDLDCGALLEQYWRSLS